MRDVLKLYIENDRLCYKIGMEDIAEEYEVYRDDKLELIIYRNNDGENRINDIKSLYVSRGIQGLFDFDNEIELIIIDKVSDKGYIINNKRDKEKLIYMQYMDSLYCSNSIDALLKMSDRKVEPDLDSICMKMILGVWSDNRNTGYKGVYCLNYGECLCFDGVCSFVDSVIQKNDNEEDAILLEILNKYMVTEFEYNEIIDIENMYNYFLSYSGFEAMDITEYTKQIVRSKLMDVIDKYFDLTVKEEPRKGFAKWIKETEILEPKTNKKNEQDIYRYIVNEWNKIKNNSYMKMLLTQAFFDSYLLREIEYDTELTYKVFELAKFLCQFEQV